MACTCSCVTAPLFVLMLLLLRFRVLLDHGECCSMVILLLLLRLLLPLPQQDAPTETVPAKTQRLHAGRLLVLLLLDPAAATIHHFTSCFNSNRGAAHRPPGPHSGLLAHARTLSLYILCCLLLMTSITTLVLLSLFST